MKVITWQDFTRGILLGTGSAAMTVGVFDGIHKGHQFLLNRIKNTQADLSIVVTFRENPRIFFKDESYPGDISTSSQKIETLNNHGIDIVILIDFSSEFSKLSGKDFLFLIAHNCDVIYLALGQNFRCGNNGMTSSYEAKEILKSKKIHVEIEKMSYFNDQLVSSTLIREAVLTGNLKRAQNMLKRVFSLDIAGIPQIVKEETIIIETKNIKQILPPQGSYVVRTGNNTEMQETKICINKSDIVIPLQKMQKLDFIKFI